MTDKEGIDLLNQIANKVLGKPRVIKAHWFCTKCKSKIYTVYLKERHDRVGHHVVWVPKQEVKA